MKRVARIVLALALVGIPANAQELPSATQIVEKSQQAFYYPEADMKAKVTMELVTDDGKTRTRVLTMLRKNVPGSQDQKYFLYFHEPGDVRRTAFLVWKYPDRDDDRWIFIPAVSMVRRVAASDSRSSFVGSDFSYEDISGRDLSADIHTLVRQEKLGDADCHVIQSVPKTAAEYSKKLSWIDTKTLLPRKEEYYDAQGELARLLTADAVEEVAVSAGDAKTTVPTVTRRTMKNVKSGHRTEVRFDSVAYDVGLDDDVFVERALQTPPRKWIE
jgi:outer membrane lipoprotein-sorting protein